MQPRVETRGRPDEYCSIMKRRLFKLAIFVLLGTVVNVAVAWVCARSMGIRDDALGEALFSVGEPPIAE